jgi:hypothetical protein
MGVFQTPGFKICRTIIAAVGVAVLLNAAVCLLPENDYQRWQTLDGTIYEHARWMYERVHFDPKPIDIAVFGSSRTELGISAAAVERDLAQRGQRANVVNFSLDGSGRDIQWAILHEIYKAKSPKAVVLMVDDQPYPFGHQTFKYIAQADAVAFPPTPFLHNYLYNLAYLPIRKLTLFGANLFPSLFGLTKQFDPDRYARSPTDFTTSFFHAGKLIDMEHPVPRATLLAEPRIPFPNTTVGRALARINGGEDHLYIRKIAAEARAHGTQVIFLFLPMFNGPESVSDLDFLKQFGPVLNYGDLAQKDELYENWAHLNHAGAMTASARLADAIADLKLSGLDQGLSNPDQGLSNPNQEARTR